MTAGETELEMAVRHVAEQENRIARQEVLIERLRKVGAPLDDALALLASKQDFVKTMRAHVARLSKLEIKTRWTLLQFKVTHYHRGNEQSSFASSSRRSSSMAAAAVSSTTLLLAASDADGLAAISALTRRERQTAELIKNGLSDKEIARRSNISLATTKSHVHNLLGKLNARRRTELADHLRR